MRDSAVPNPDTENRRAATSLLFLAGAGSAIRSTIRKNALLWSAFIIPVAVMIVILYLYKVHPFGEFSLVNEELFRTYLPLLTELRRKILSGDSLFYSWNIGYGVNFFAYFGMFLASPLNLLAVFFPESAIPGVITLQVLLRVGLSGLGFAMLLLEKDQLRNAFLPALSSAYALGGYMLAYSRDSSVADAVVLLPFILLGTWRVIMGRRPILFTVSLFFLFVSALSASLYVGLFLTLMIPLFYMEAGGKHLEKHSKIPVGIRFVLYGILAVAGAAVILVPTLIAFRSGAGASQAVETGAYAGSAPSWIRAATAGPFKFPDDLKMYFTFFDLGDRMLFRTVPEIGLRMPNIYCGVAVMLLVPLFAFCDRIAFRERVYSLALVGFLYVTMSGSLIDYALNGLQITERNHFKQAFLLSFLLLYMAARALRYAETFSRRTVFLSVMGVFAFLVLDDHSGEVQRAWQAIYGTAALVLIFGMCVRALSGTARWHRAARTFFLIFIVAELSFTAVHATDVRVKAEGQANYALHARYEQSVREGIETVPESAQTLFRVAADSVFTDYDGAYAGVMIPDAPALLSSGDFISFAQQNGFGDRMQSRLYTPSMNEVSGMLFGIGGELRFVKKSTLPVSDEPVGDIEEGEIDFPVLGVGSYQNLAKPTGAYPADSVGTFKQVEFTINRHALPAAYRVDSGIKEPFDSAFPSPFDNADTILNLMGLEPLYIEKSYTITDERNVLPAEGGQFSFVSESGSAYILVRPADLSVGERLFLSINTKLEVRITVRVFEADESANPETFMIRSGQIIDCGARKDENTRIEVSVFFPSCSAEPFSIIAKGISEESYERAFRALEKQSIRGERLDGSGIRGSIEVDQDGVLFFSVPYEQGWSVRIDGKTAETSKAAGVWLSVPIQVGSHLVAARYTPPGFAVGLLVSLLAVSIFITLSIWNPGRIMGLSKEQGHVIGLSKEEEPGTEMNSEATSNEAVDKEMSSDPTTDSEDDA
jgi:uncharacterized membrane protein YfhO